MFKNLSNQTYASKASFDEIYGKETDDSSNKVNLNLQNF